MSNSKVWTLLGSLLKLWMDEKVSQQSNKKSLMMKNLQMLTDVTTKLSQIVPTWVVETRALNRRSMLEILMYFALGLIL